MVLLVEICGVGEVNMGAFLGRGVLLFVGHHHRLVHRGDSLEGSSGFLRRIPDEFFRIPVAPLCL